MKIIPHRDQLTADVLLEAIGSDAEIDFRDAQALRTAILMILAIGAFEIAF